MTRRLFLASVILISLLCMMAPAVARTYSFSNSDGDGSGYQGMVGIDEDGNIAFTIVAAVNGEYATSQAVDDADIHAEQEDTSATGWAVFAGSGAANTDGDSATTADMAVGDGSIYTDQGAGATTYGAAAGQENTAISGDQAIAASSASNDGQEATSVAVVDEGEMDITVQGAEAYGYDVSTGQVASGTGEDVAFAATASAGSATATALTSASTTEATGCCAEDCEGTACANVNQGAEASFFGAEAEQDALAEGDEVIIRSTAEGMSSATAETIVTDGTAEVYGQEAGVNWFGAEAEQDYASAEGAAISIGCYADQAEQYAGSVTEVINGDATVEYQDAEASHFFGIATGSYADQTTSASGDEIRMETAAGYEEYSSADTRTLVSDGFAAGDQEAGWFYGASADQAMLAFGAEVNLDTSATNGDDEAGTHAGATDAFNVDAIQSADAMVGAGAAAEQGAVIAAEAGNANTYANAADGNSANTYAYFDPTELGLIVTDQEALAAGGDATAGQDTLVTVATGFAAAGSDAVSDDDDVASTRAEVYDGGWIETLNGAGAGDVSVFGIDAYGAAAGQYTEVIANDGGYAGSSASNELQDQGEAGTYAEIWGDGNISTMQGAAAGTVSTMFIGHPIDAEGAVAAQFSDLDSDEGGVAESWSNNEYNNYASTTASYSGLGYINNTLQGAAAGEIEVFGDDWLEGAIAGQHTDEIYSAELDSNTASATSSANNEDENFADTYANAYGEGTIRDTTQIAAAGEGDLFHLGVDLEGAFAGQETACIEGTEGGNTGSNSYYLPEEEPCHGCCGGDCDDEDYAFANTAAFFRGDGFIAETTSGAAAGEVEFTLFGHPIEIEGAGAGQYTGRIEGEFSEAYSYAYTSEETASTDAYSDGEDGYVAGTFQGAAAGEVEVFDNDFLDGAFAFQHTDDIYSCVEDTAYAATYAYNDEASAVTYADVGNGHIYGTTQGAAAGDASLFHLGVEMDGAVAGQHTDAIEGTDGRAWSEVFYTPSACGDPYALTDAGFYGTGSIVDTTQVAAGGEVAFSLFGSDIELEGVGAGQGTAEITSDTYGYAWSMVADDVMAPYNSATVAEFSGEGSIEGTIQGAVQGEAEFDLFGHPVELEGSAAGQHTDLIVSDTSGSAYTESYNEGMWSTDYAGTRAWYNGAGSIVETTQVAAEGEVEVFDIEVLEGAIAFQDTEEVASTNPVAGNGGVWSSAADYGLSWTNEEATTEAGYIGGGSVEGATQVAATGEAVVFHPGIPLGADLDGAIAVQSVDRIYSTEEGYAVSDAIYNDYWPWWWTESSTAHSEVRFDDQGEITGLIQGAVGGEFEVNGVIDVDGEGAVAGQHFDSLTSYGNPGSLGLHDTGSGFAETSASTTETLGPFWSSTDTAGVRVDETEYFYNGIFVDNDFPGYVNGVTQVAGAGDFSTDFFWAEGAAAVQGVDDGSWYLVPTFEMTSEASYNNGPTVSSSDWGPLPFFEGTSWAAAGEFNGFTTAGSTAGWLPVNLIP